MCAHPNTRHEPSSSTHVLSCPSTCRARAREASHGSRERNRAAASRARAFYLVGERREVADHEITREIGRERHQARGREQQRVVRRELGERREQPRPLDERGDEREHARGARREHRHQPQRRGLVPRLVAAERAVLDLGEPGDDDERDCAWVRQFTVGARGSRRLFGREELAKFADLTDLDTL